MDRSTYAAQQVLEQLKNRSEYYNRNHLQIKLDDKESAAVNRYCEKHNLTHSQFLRQLITIFLNHV